MQDKIHEFMKVVQDGYDYEISAEIIIPDYTNEKELSEFVLKVDNPSFDPTNGSDPFLTITVKG